MTEYAETHTGSNGPQHLIKREIIARQPATMESPKTGEAVTVRDVTQVLLAPAADGSTDADDTAFVCNICGSVHETARGGASHLRAHSDKPSTPRYPIETLKLLIRLVKTGYRDNLPDPMEYAKDELNRRGFRMRNGQLWIRSSVADMYRRWESTIRVRVPRAASDDTTVNTTDVGEVVPHGSYDTVIDATNRIVKAMEQLMLAMTTLQQLFDEIEPTLIELTDAARTAPVSDDVKEKARRWEEMQRLLSQ